MKRLRGCASASNSSKSSQKFCQKPRLGTHARPIRFPQGLRIREGAPSPLAHRHAVPCAGGFAQRVLRVAQTAAVGAIAVRRCDRRRARSPLRTIALDVWTPATRSRLSQRTWFIQSASQSTIPGIFTSRMGVCTTRRQTLSSIRLVVAVKDHHGWGNLARWHYRRCKWHALRSKSQTK